MAQAPVSNALREGLQAVSREVRTVLVLKRKVEESITISENIRVKILSITGESVNVGVDAPREIKVFRTENLRDGGNGKNGGSSNGKLPPGKDWLQR